MYCSQPAPTCTDTQHFDVVLPCLSSTLLVLSTGLCTAVSLQLHANRQSHTQVRHCFALLEQHAVYWSCLLAYVLQPASPVYWSSLQVYALMLVLVQSV